MLTRARVPKRLPSYQETRRGGKNRVRAPLTFSDLADAKHSVDIGSLNSSGAPVRLRLPQHGYCNMHCGNDAFVIHRLDRFRAKFVRPISFSLLTPI